jgi:hypothetical protein
MSTSQFRIFKSTDPGAPSLFGTTGSLVTVLDYCLITGSGWIKPFPNTSSFVANATANDYACWQQPTGSGGTGSAGMTLFVNDGAPNGTALYKEAWATGWEVLTSLSASVTNGVGTGSGQFPLPGQLLTTGHVVIRKSTTSDGTNARPWIITADSSSFYLFVSTGDTANTYFGFGFGDVYSFKSGSNDAYRCIIIGRSAENSTAAGNEGMDLLSALATGTTGTFMARTFGGAGSSITASKSGDSVKGSSTTLLGNLYYPNSTDNAFYSSPIWVAEGSNIRGQLRGMYQILHPIANFLDGTNYTGSADFNGKTFTIVKTTPNSGLYLIETSNTLLTN